MTLDDQDGPNPWFKREFSFCLGPEQVMLDDGEFDFPQPQTGNLKDEIMAEDNGPNLEILRPPQRRGSIFQQCRESGDDHDWESTWVKRGELNDLEPLLPCFGQKRLTEKTAPSTPTPKDGDEAANSMILQPVNNIAMIPCVDVSASKSGTADRKTMDKK